MREAILKAADHIQSNPSVLNFEMCRPSDPQGCPLVWISRFGGFYEKAGETAKRMIGEGPGDSTLRFFERMNEIAGDMNWISNPDVCARSLRVYADRFYPVKQITYRMAA